VTLFAAGQPTPGSVLKTPFPSETSHPTLLMLICLTSSPPHPEQATGTTTCLFICFSSTTGPDSILLANTPEEAGRIVAGVRGFAAPCRCPSPYGDGMAGLKMRHVSVDNQPQQEQYSQP